MGFYLRKSISVGPFRFNLSQSGTGVSAGVKGFRLGVGPRGNYIRMGRNGFYYRATIPPSSSTPRPKQHLPNQFNDPQIPSGTHAPLEEIESADVSNIVDSSSRELLEELNRKQKTIRLWPIIAVICAATLMYGYSSDWPSALQIAVGVLGAVSIFIAYNRDILAKTVVLFYNFEPDMENAYSMLHTSAEQLAGCSNAWHIEAAGKVHDRKYHAGASDLVRRKPTFIHKVAPPYVKTNIETIAIGVGRQTLHFFPDRVLVYDQNGVGAVGYQELHMSIESARFIESEGVPKDANVVGKTWRYVNKTGGPDRRFKDNKEMPICLYEEISLSSQTGLNEVLQISRCGTGQPFADAIKSLAIIMPKENGHTHADDELLIA